MARWRDETDMGGENRGFEETLWNVVQDAQSDDPARQQKALNELATLYWKPVYCYLRRRGHRNEAAKDLTQGFLADIALDGGLIQGADPQKGRFRTFLLTALDHYAVSQHRKETAQKRMPPGGLASLDDTESLDLPPDLETATPSQAFDYACATEVLDRVLAELRQEHEQNNEMMYWELFVTRFLHPIRYGAQPPPLQTQCRELGIADPKDASNIVTTVKRRFGAALRRHFRQFVQTDEDVQEEIDRLMTELSGRPAGPSPAPRIHTRRQNTSDDG
ncbi:MAG: sigma-70 family RNA polymerase sigma factor [Candidatus Brocadiae bacterium]|nr:sigma-70 family RNA polymerase sigma factor [Candidatus Brocadiia bacterium]